MKKLNQLLLIILIGLISTSALSQDFWEQLYFPDTTKIRCIDVNDNGDIFVGTGGTNTIGGVYRSIDNPLTM